MRYHVTSELQNLCEENDIRFKGKTKAQLRELLGEKNIQAGKDDLEHKSVKELKEMCERKGISKTGNKEEIRKRLKSADKDSEGLALIKWNQRGRKVAQRQSEAVDDESDDDDDDNEYKSMKKNELKQECLKRNLPAAGPVKVLIKRLLENDDIAKIVGKNGHEKPCESCEENPQKLYNSSISKWFCVDCNEHICHICKDAHEKLKVTRSHEIRPYGTLLEFHIGNDHSFNPERLDDDNSAKRKRYEDEDVDNNDENPDMNNSFELVYETPMAKIAYKGNKRILLQMNEVTVIPETPAENSVLESSNSESVAVTPPPVWVTPVPPRPQILFPCISPLEDSMPHVTFVQETPEPMDQSRDMFESSIAESPLYPPIPPPMPKSKINFVQTIPITPARLQGQRWRNWARTRLSHLPRGEVYTDEEVIENIRRNAWNMSIDGTEIERDVPAVVIDIPLNNDIIIDIEQPEQENVEAQESQVPPKSTKTLTAKNVKEKKRKLAFEVPPEEKIKCAGKWTYNYQGGETYCVDGFSYTINNHLISKKTGALTLYLICTKCGGRNVLCNGNLKKHDHPGHTCTPDPDNWELFEADLRLKSLGD